MTFWNQVCGVCCCVELFPRPHCTAHNAFLSTACWTPFPIAVPRPVDSPPPAGDFSHSTENQGLNNDTALPSVDPFALFFWHCPQTTSSICDLHSLDADKRPCCATSRKSSHVLEAKKKKNGNGEHNPTHPWVMFSKQKKKVNTHHPPPV